MKPANLAEAKVVRLAAGSRKIRNMIIIDARERNRGCFV